MLAIDKLSKRYEGVHALNQVSLTVSKGTIKGLIGPNGSGKSTLFHLVSGIERQDSGTITFKGTEMTSMDPHERSLLGMGRTFQALQVWKNMTVVDNILAAMHRRLKQGFLSAGFWSPGVRKEEKEALKEAKEILEFMGLLGRWEWPASQLSFGEQKMVEMGRALAMRPDILLLDEPASGLTPAEIQILSQKIRRLKEGGMTLFIIEHRLELLMKIADEIAVLHNGSLIAEGPPDEIRSDEKVIHAYLKGARNHA